MQGDIAFYGPLRHSIDAKLCVARNKSNLAILAANRIFIKILLATGWSLPGFSSSLSVGLAMPASVNGVGTSFKDDGLTFARLYSNFLHRTRGNRSYRTSLSSRVWP